MAARDALRRLFGTEDTRHPLALEEDLQKLDLNKAKKQSNLRITEWSRNKLENIVRLEG